MLISYGEGLRRLKAAVDHAGGVNAFASKVGVNQSMISNALSGSRAIPEKVARYLGLEAVRAYNEIENFQGIKGEQYRKSREEWDKQVEAQGYKTGKNGVRKLGYFVPHSIAYSIQSKAMVERIEALSQTEAEAKAYRHKPEDHNSEK